MSYIESPLSSLHSYHWCVKFIILQLIYSYHDIFDFLLEKITKDEEILQIFIRAFDV